VPVSDRQLGHAEGTPATTPTCCAAPRARLPDEWTDQRANALLLDAAALAALAAIDIDDETGG